MSDLEKVTMWSLFALRRPACEEEMSVVESGLEGDEDNRLFPRIQWVAL